jgi:hypothetical protein
MPALVIPNSFSPNTTAQSADVNANFSAIAALLNSTKLDADNIQALGITAALLAANAVTGAKLNSNVVDDSTLQYSSSQLSIKALGVNTAHLAANAVTTAKITDANVTTAKIADANVTRAKLEALGQQLSSSSSTFSSASGTLTDVTNLSVSITTTGRPVWVGTQAVSTGVANAGHFRIAGAAGSIAGHAAILKDGTVISCVPFAGNSITSLYVPCSAIWYIDAPSAGTYTYKVQVAATAGTSVEAYNMKLIAYEL